MFYVQRISPLPTLNFELGTLNSSRLPTLALLLLRSAPVTPFTRRVLIRIGGFLRRAQFFRHISEVHSDAGPGRRPATHGVDQHVVHGEKRGDFGMFTLPPF